MVAATQAVRDAMVLFILIKRFISLTEHEVFDSFMKLFGVKLAESSSEIAFWELWINLNWFVEIVNG
jgi:type II restriction/modification system DNA methylase subunit YeeA